MTTISNTYHFTCGGGQNASFNRIGRLTLVEDATGAQEFFYVPYSVPKCSVRGLAYGQEMLVTLFVMRLDMKIISR